MIHFNYLGASNCFKEGPLVLVLMLSVTGTQFHFMGHAVSDITCTAALVTSIAACIIGCVIACVFSILFFFLIMSLPCWYCLLLVCLVRLP